MFRKLSLLCLVSLTLCQVAFARRAAPSFQPYEIRSENGAYIAVVHQTTDGSWWLTVQSTDPEASRIPLWSCAFDYDGYPGYGVLSDDGRSFVRYAQIFDSEASLVDIYTDGVCVARLTATDLDLSVEDLPERICPCTQTWIDTPTFTALPLIGLAQDGTHHNTCPMVVLTCQDGLSRLVALETGALQGTRQR